MNSFWFNKLTIWYLLVVSDLQIVEIVLYFNSKFLLNKFLCSVCEIVYKLLRSYVAVFQAEAEEHVTERQQMPIFDILLILCVVKPLDNDLIFSISFDCHPFSQIRVAQTHDEESVGNFPRSESSFSVVRSEYTVFLKLSVSVLFVLEHLCCRQVPDNDKSIRRGMTVDLFTF